MIRFEIKKSIISGKLIIYLLVFLILYIIYIVFFAINTAYPSTFQFIQKIWDTLFRYIFPLFISYICADIFTRDYEQGHFKHILLIVKNKYLIWFVKFFSILMINFILIISTILFGIIGSLLLNISFNSLYLGDYFQFISTNFLNLIPITLLFIFVSIISNKMIQTLINTIIIYIFFIIIHFIFNLKSLTPFDPLLASSKNSLSTFFYVIAFVIVNLIYINKKELSN